MLASPRRLAMAARVVLSFLSVTLILALIVDYVRMLRLRSRMVSFMASLSSPILLIRCIFQPPGPFPCRYLRVTLRRDI
jgi:hypothetical protein